MISSEIIHCLNDGVADYLWSYLIEKTLVPFSYLTAIE